MRNVIATTVVVLLSTLAAGCSTKPPRDVDAAVRQRLTKYSEAWKQGDANGVRDSFAPRNADEVAMLDALAQLAPAQAKLRTAYYEKLGPTGRIIFGDGDATTLVPGTRQWESYARSAAHPYDLVYKKALVLVQLHENDRQTIVPARRVDGGWKLELGGFLHGKDVPEMTKTMRLQVDRTNELTAAVGTGDAREVQRVMLKHIMDLRGPEGGTLEEIMGAGSTTRSATAPTTRRGAKENPP